MHRLEVKTITRFGEQLERTVDVAVWREERAIPLLEPFVKRGMIAAIFWDGRPVRVLHHSADQELRERSLPSADDWREIRRPFRGGESDE